MRGDVTRLIILASTTLYREALRSLMASQLRIDLVGAVGALSDVKPLVGTEQRTAVLVDISDTHAEFVQQLCTIAPNSGVLFLVDEYDLDIIIPLLKAGAMGCISRNAPLDELAGAIVAAGRGEIVLPPAIAKQALATLARGRQTTDNNPPFESLTEREIDVLRLLARGMTNKDIAQTLFLSVRTVEAHLRNIYGKLGVQSRTEAALWAVTSGYLSDK